MTFCYGSLHEDVLVLTDQQESTNNYDVQTQDLVWKTCWEQWMIGTNGEKESGKSMLATRLDDDAIKPNDVKHAVLKSLPEPSIFFLRAGVTRMTFPFPRYHSFSPMWEKKTERICVRLVRNNKFWYIFFQNSIYIFWLEKWCLENF